MDHPLIQSVKREQRPVEGGVQVVRVVHLHDTPTKEAVQTVRKFLAERGLPEPTEILGPESDDA